MLMSPMRDGQTNKRQAKIELLSFCSVNHWVSQKVGPESCWLRARFNVKRTRCKVQGARCKVLTTILVHCHIACAWELLHRRVWVEIKFCGDSRDTLQFISSLRTAPHFLLGLSLQLPVTPHHTNVTLQNNCLQKNFTRSWKRVVTSD